MDTRRAWGAAGAAGAVALLLAVIALASRPDAGGPSPLLPEAPAQVALDALSYLLLAFAILTFAVIVWALWPRPEDEPPILPVRRSSPLVLLLLAAIVVLIAIRLRAASPNRPLLPLPLGASRLAPPSMPGSPASAHPTMDWLALAIVAALLAAGGILAWRWLRSPTGRARPTDQLRAVLDEAIEEAEDASDPRRAVIAAWARVERVLSRHGLPRHRSEAPFEYAARADGELGVRLDRLAELFEWARFSAHDVTVAMREEALTGLHGVRDSLAH